MKYISRFLFIIATVLLMVSVSCERDENGPLPDEGMRDGGLAYVSFEETSDYLVDLLNPDAFHLDYSVDVLWEPSFSQIELVVVYNKDYATQNVLATITSVPTTGSISMADIVSAVSAIGSSGDLAEGDDFHFFVNMTLSDGTMLRTYQDIGTKKGVFMVGAGLVQALAAVEGATRPDVVVPVPCAFDKADYIGTGIDCYERWNDGSGDVAYPIDVVERADLAGTNELVLELRGLFTGNPTPGTDDYSSYIITIDLKRYTIDADPVQMIVANDLFGWGLGRLWLEDWAFPALQTCGQYLQFNAAPILNDTGLWWGTDLTYFIGPGALAAGGGKKSAGLDTVLRRNSLIKK